MSDLPPAGPGERWWVALVCFGRGEDHLGWLDEYTEGALGWMACRAADETAAETVFREGLAAIGLPLLEVEDLEPIAAIDDAAGVDPYLAENLAEFEAGKLWTWGQLFPYVAEGEA